MKSITEIRSALFDIQKSLEEQRETDPAPGLEHYIECLAVASELLVEKEPLEVKRYKAKCSCGETVYPHEKFCPNCGRPLEWRF